MKRLLSKNNSDIDNGDDLSEAIQSVTSRSVDLNAITKAPFIRETPAMEVWDSEPSSRQLAGRSVRISDPMWRTIQNGKPISEIIKASPEEVMAALREHAVKKLGTFTATDVEVLLSFGKSSMLTHGSDEARDMNYETNWRQVIHDRVRKNRKRRQYYKGAWEQKVKLTAYVVNIEDAAAPQNGGLLHPLVKKSQTGGAKLDVWAFPSVQAVVEYKWVHWARYLCLIEFGLYLGWLISFTLFLLTYIEWNLNKDFDDQSGIGKFFAVNSNFLNVISLGFMAPFVLIEINTIRHYRLQWLQFWNIMDSLAFFLQIAISYGQLSKMFLNASAYDTLMAAHCILLYLKVQYFARLFGEGSSFIELILRVVKKVQAFLYFIILSMISMTFAFTVLYREDRESNSDAATDFRNVIRSMVTTYAILLGDFNPSYVFDTTNKVVKGIFFLAFQLMMSITVLNLLIAVVTESYAAIMDQRKIMHNMSKAQAMDEMEISLPRWFRPKMKPFCHFLVVTPDEEEPSDSTIDNNESSNTQSIKEVDMTELKSGIEELSTMKNDVVELKSSVHHLSGLKSEVVELKSSLEELKQMIKDMAGNSQQE